jgi:hypothetical protein
VGGGLLLAVVLLAALANKGGEPTKAEDDRGRPPANSRPPGGQGQPAVAPSNKAEASKAKMLRVAEKMGDVDLAWAQYAVGWHEGGIGWKTIDDKMVTKVTNETWAAYQEWRAAAIAGE